MEFKKILEKGRLIAAVRKEEDLELILKSEAKIIFLLAGNILNIEEMTKKIKKAKKISFVHTEMIEGLDPKSEKTIDFIIENSFADGIISTKVSIVKYAKKKGLMTIQRCFLLDSLSLESMKKILKESNFDAVEILPGVMPKIIKKLSKEISVPIIAGGLITDLEDVETVIKSGGLGASTTNLKLIKQYYKIKD